MQAIEGVVERKRQGDVRERVDAVGKRQIERPHALFGRAGGDDGLDHRVRADIAVAVR